MVSVHRKSKSVHSLLGCSLPRQPRPRFGAGILPTRPSYRAPFTASDEAWLIEDNARRDAENRDLEQRAAEARFMDAFEMGVAL